MEALIVFCLIIAITLMISDKITTGRKKPATKEVTQIPASDIMGTSKFKGHPLPINDTAGQKENSGSELTIFESRAERMEFEVEIPLDEPDDVFMLTPDLSDEELEFSQDREPLDESDFAMGVSFEELGKIGALLSQEILSPAEQSTAIGIAKKIEGTDLVKLLEVSMESASQKITALLDSSLSLKTASGSFTSNQPLQDFDINNFM